MALVMTPIYTQTVGAGGASSIVFNNIPQHFTDLKLVVSSRAVDSTLSEPWVRFNSDSGSNYSFTRLYGNGSNAFSDRGSAATILFTMFAPGSSYTANTFSNSELYIPNYTSSNFKSLLSDTTAENNATTGYLGLYAGLWRSTSAITSITVAPAGTGFAQYSTFSLYGIIRSGA